MFSKKEWIIFAAGAAAFHTLSHIAIAYTSLLPLRIFGIEWTSMLNLFAIAINAILTGALLYWAAHTK